VTATKIISELRAIDEYLGSATPDDEPAGFIVVRRQRETLVKELKRLHDVDYEGIRATERLGEEYEHERLFNEFNATLKKFMRRGGP
jgi:hypothetical protein